MIDDDEIHEIDARWKSETYDSPPQHWVDRMTLLRSLSASRKLVRDLQDAAADRLIELEGVRNHLKTVKDDRDHLLKRIREGLPPEEPEHDYALMVTHRFPSIYESTKGNEKIHFVYEESDHVEKVVWVFVCRRTGKMIEVVHKGPL